MEDLEAHHVGAATFRDQAKLPSDGGGLELYQDLSHTFWVAGSGGGGSYPGAPGGPDGGAHCSRCKICWWWQC